jgi:hypothetical protein
MTMKEQGEMHQRHRRQKNVASARCDRMRILYVDLNPESMSGGIDKVLRNRGHMLLYVSTCCDALEMIRNQDVDAVVITQNSLEVFDLIAKAQAIRGELSVFVTEDWRVSELPLALEWCGGLQEARNHLHV